MSAVRKQVGLRALENCTFTELSFSYKGLCTCLAGSYICHLIFIVVLFYFYTQGSKFVMPHVVKTGHDVHGATQLYWFPGNRGRGAESTSRTRKSAISNGFVPQGKGEVVRFSRNVPRTTSNKTVVASAADSLGNASLNGDDIRPAIPIATLDPVITPADLGGVKGEVIVEVTIDSSGNMVATKLEHGLGQVVDQKVLATVKGWRFRPAMKDGRPISSKQDIHYYFPTNDGDATKHGAPLAAAVTQSPCPVLLVSGAADQNQISITFINMGKLAIRQLEFSCGPSNSIIGNVSDQSPCRENNALFYPGQKYTLEYANQHRSRHLQISVKTVMLSDGYVWKPSRGQSCRVVTIEVNH